MKYSAKYEVAIKQALANRLEIRELSKIAKEDINKFHMNLRSQAITIEMLNKVRFKLRNNYIILSDTLIRKKLKMSNIIKTGEEVFADRDDKSLTARRVWKEACQQIIIKIQAFKMSQQIQRTQDARIYNFKKKIMPVLTESIRKDNKIREDYNNVNDSYDDYIGESYCSEDESMGQISENSFENSQLDNSDNFSKDQADSSLQNEFREAQSQKSVLNEISSFGKLADTQAFEDRYKMYIPQQKAVQQPPSFIYEIIQGTLYSDESNIKWPNTTKAKIIYILMIPLTHLQWVSIPSPLVAGRQNLYPVSLFMSLLWIFAYSYVIVWFTYVITTAYDLHFSILPMILYPFGIALRDYKKFKDMTSAMKSFKLKIKDQKLSLAETFSGPIFQITGLMGITWTLYITFLGADYVKF